MSDGMELNGTGAEAAPTPVMPSTIQEPEDRLLPVQTPSMPAAMGGLPVLHLHRHEHVEGTVDTEARAVLERLATQHGEIFTYLQGEIRELQEDVVRKQFSTDLVHWVEAARGVMTRQGQELQSLRADL